ncbi:hypothetical protein COCC4DRAFT_85271 [Bipolaris maydis ATCC 48331]|uniref:Zn(2)-C6 fungal-type domain-containing protein n=2 Tax=Cochliobolus heterostrophus TaxID=5016 RepID=M2V189_COCH5|nr:uncharacterized protein COCC4DRAFT_85271 [Bipolaris maydis ATCC 48331]EMD93717.1 hypothetical protein COCHEDRAFT_1171775 [Bipolaris maydis C5]KAH7562613.1 hypothetical protein BM1_02133 [Bipolaris maydis]ENH99291.1 hypothetical protein COCC4DRAFT_85271 [Bipolaris maydis ATCC 48331]KAJ5028004.1 hypothetical protein J3E73DRAFT_422471 [Bipolaris maydis]KAJ5062777.1 hypothetical protein J3E74DRAFT_416639 [Bipolaris maydis]
MQAESDWTDEPSRSSKRRRTDAERLARPRKYHVEGKYCDRYRLLFNGIVREAATRFDNSHMPYAFYSWQIGSSLWSTAEQATFYSALQRLGRDDVPGIADAVGKSIPEVRELLLLLHGAAVKQGNAGLTFRDIPAAVEIGDECDAQVELAADALAWYQEKWEARQEQKQHGDYWLITSAVADAIENAIDGEADEPAPPRRGGRVIVGACLSCKKFKQKCDRELPCSNCRRRKTAQCVYPESSTKADQPVNSEEPQKDGEPDKPDHAPTTPAILESLPEGSLLHPQNMLKLSRDVFMNRSPTIPSPWPHWSQCTSDIAQEPSIYRTAFGDFHNLVVSVTTRLVRLAMIQSMSRLRSRSKRTTHGALPTVRKRDVRTAVDLAGMPRNSQERWRGVARRCALRVYDQQLSRHGRKKIKREVPWDEFERIMRPEEPIASTLTTDVESSDDQAEARLRAARKGTPLPIEQLALSDSDESSLDETMQSSQPTQPSRDTAGRYTTGDGQTPKPPTLTLKQHDRKNAQMDELEMWIMLGHDPDKSKYLNQIGPVSDEDDEEDERVITQPDDWRSFTKYRVEWEELETLPTPQDFEANHTPLAVPPVLHDDTVEPQDSSSDYTDGPGKKKQRPRKPEPVELEAESAHAYANRKARELAQEMELPMSESSRQGHGMSSASSDSGGEGRYKVRQSIETGGRRAVHSDDEVSEMDWDTFID